MSDKAKEVMFIPGVPVKMITFDMSKLRLWKTIIMRTKPLNMNEQEERLWKLLYEDDDS